MQIENSLSLLDKEIIISDSLDRDIYTKKDRTYWSELDADMHHFCAEQGLPYVRNDDSVRSRHGRRG